MSVLDFIRSIGESRLVALAEHWNDARRGRAMPGWRDIDPIAIWQTLPIVWSWRWDSELNDFVGRLAGEEVERVLGCSVRGRRIAQVFGAATAPLVKTRYLDLMRGPALGRSIGQVFSHVGMTGSGEQIILPLGPDRSGAGGVIGATVYHLRAVTRTASRPFDEGSDQQTFPLAVGALASASAGDPGRA